MNAATEKKLLLAYAYLFPEAGTPQASMLSCLNPEALKKAFREQARFCHPDAHVAEGADRVRGWTERFKAMGDAYEILLAHLDGRLEDEAAPRGRIIAVGGAKGGIGKSVFTATLGILLARRGHRVALIDLDLGGANLSLYLGEKYLLDRTINDFLAKKYPSLDDILMETRQGPLVIGGDSSQLGSTNIPFAQKLKLMRAIRNLQADYILLDLGGDTSYNILDFFLLGEVGIVLATREPAAYIGAYQFIKTALYRKISRLGGPESRFDQIEEKGLSRLLQESALADGGAGVRSIDALLARVREQAPLESPLLVKAILDFRPLLVVNRAASPQEGSRVGQTILALVRKNLGIEASFPGFVSEYSGLGERMTAGLAPASAPLAARLDAEMTKLLDTILS